MTLRVASDIGGTFTDLVCFDEQTGELRIAKTSTTPDDLSRGVLSTIEKAQVDLLQMSFFVHGTTVVINALTERKGSRTGLLTTQGFRDILEIGRANRPDLYNFSFQKPEPFVPRNLRLEVAERINYKGEILRPLNEDDVRRGVSELLNKGVEAIAVCFLHSYANPAHELRAAEIARAEAFGIPVTASSEITREWREYERTNTAVLNAYVKPTTARYLTNLENSLTERGAPRQALHVMQSNGGTATFEHARTTPIHLVESGPVASVIGAIALGRFLGEENIISLDIGGTTAKSSLVHGGKVRTTNDYRIEWTPASPGYPIMVPVVDIVEIGAGGGSIAWIDRAGGLKVGPQSAGAVPGPACYGKAGQQPTVTDAGLLTGRIDPDYFLGGSIRVDVAAARRAVRRIAEPLGMTEGQAALGILRLSNANMENLLKVVSLRRGFDPRDFCLIAFGGGGPMHATALARSLHINRVIIPMAPACFSAWGMLMTDLRADFLQTAIMRSDSAEAGALQEIIQQLEARAHRYFQLEGIDLGRVVTERLCDMRYVGQQHTVKVRLPDGELLGAAMEEIRERFHVLHEHQYTFRLDTAVEIVNVHLTGLGMVEKPSPKRLCPNGRDPMQALMGHRDVDFDPFGLLRSALYERSRLGPGTRIEGPAIVEEPAATTVLFSGDSLEVDEYGNFMIEVPPGGGSQAA
jgi:N-methylhydantoinase A